MNRLRPATSLILAALLPLQLAGGALASSCDCKGWREFVSVEAGIRLCHPETWDVTVAKERIERGSAWAPTVLEKGELHKLTFRPAGDVICSGQYEVRVLANPENLDLETFYSRLDLSDLWDGSPAETTVGGERGRTWVRWRYDSLVREYLLMGPVGAVYILHDEDNANDPDFADHKAIYFVMTSTITLGVLKDQTEHEDTVSPD